VADTDLIIGFAAYAVVTSITPGPNNMMIMASGLNFGFRRSIPHLAGITLGFAMMVFLVGAGAGAVFEIYPFLHDALRLAGATYLLYLAWQIAIAGPINDEGSTNTKPMSFLGAAAFQWVNPKAWIMAVGAIATYLPGDPLLSSVAVIAVVFAILNAPCVAVWAALGQSMQSLLRDPMHVKIFNRLMALLLVASLYPVLF
jgi:threonine/homoserine/homoserine lactone efflux protein